MSNNKKALKSGVWYTAANFLMKSLAFITTPIFTRMLSKEQYGAFQNFASWQGIFAVFVTLNLGTTLISARYDFKKDLDRYITSMLALGACSVIGFCLICNLFGTFFTDLLALKQQYINLIFVYLLFSPAVDIFQANERFFYRYKMSVFIAVLVAFGTMGLSVWLIYIIQDKLLGRTLGAVIPTVLIGIIIAFYYIKKGKGIYLPYWRYALPICLPYIPHMLSLTLLNAMDKTMITKICGAEDTALYSLAYTCGMIVSLFLTSMNTAYSPWLAEHLDSGNYEEVYAFSKKYILAFSGIAVGVMIFAPEVLFILGGKDYMNAKYVMPPVSAGCICQFLYTMFVNIEQFMKKTVGMAVASTSAAVLNLVLNLWLIPKFGYIAAAYTTLASYFWLLVFHMILVRRMRLGKIYDYKFILGIVGAVLVFTAAVNYFYFNFTLRILLMAVYAGIFLFVLYRNRQVLLGFLKRDNGVKNGMGWD